MTDSATIERWQEFVCGSFALGRKLAMTPAEMLACVNLMRVRLGKVLNMTMAEMQQIDREVRMKDPSELTAEGRASANGDPGQE